MDFFVEEVDGGNWDLKPSNSEWAKTQSIKEITEAGVDFKLDQQIQTILANENNSQEWKKTHKYEMVTSWAAVSLLKNLDQERWFEKHSLSNISRHMTSTHNLPMKHILATQHNTWASSA